MKVKRPKVTWTVRRVFLHDERPEDVTAASYLPFATYPVFEVTASIEDRVFVLNYHYALEKDVIEKRVRELYAEELENSLCKSFSPTSPMNRSPPSPGIFLMDLDKDRTAK